MTGEVRSDWEARSARWSRWLRPRSVGMQVALVLTLVFLPVAAIMVGVAALNYREALYRNETEMLRYLGRVSELREARLARSALLATTLGRLEQDAAASPVDCQSVLEGLHADDIWSSAQLVTTRGAQSQISPCGFEAESGGDPENTTRVVHSLGEFRRVEAQLAPLELERPVGLEAGAVGDFTQDWRPVAASPVWGLDDWPFEADGGPTVFSSALSDGETYTYALGSIDRYGVASVFAIPTQDFYAPAQARLVTTLGLLLTILVLGIISAWASIEWVVLRRLRGVQGVARSLAAGDLAARVQSDRGTPIELHELGSSINDMAGRIERRTREVEGAVGEQRRLLRELHHRVKNNFQVIASLLSLQRRSLPEPYADVLRYPEDHVAAMATAYRISYASGDIGDVGLPEMASQFVSHVLRSADLPASRLGGDVVVDNVSIDLDSAVALGMLLTELLVPVCREAAKTGATARLDMLAGVAGLNIFIAGPAPTSDAKQGSLPHRFTTAFLNQVDGEMEVHEEEPFYRARVRIPVERLHFKADESD